MKTLLRFILLFVLALGASAQVGDVKKSLSTNVLLGNTPLVFPQTGLGLLDTDGTHYLLLKNGANLAATRSLTFTTTGDTNVTFPTSGTLLTSSVIDGYFADPSTNASFSASAWRTDLGLSTADSPGFANVTVGGALRLSTGGTTATYQDSTFIGRDAGLVNNTPAATNGIYNTFVGSQAGKANTSGYAQAFFGYNAGGAVTTGGRNTFIGYQSGAATTTGNDNVFIGVDAGGFAAANTSGSVIIGFHAGQNTSFSGYAENVIIGYETVIGASTGSLNTIVGNRSGYSNTTGYANTFLGRLSGFTATTGLFNTFLGESAGTSVTTGGTSTYVGSRAGYSNLTGNANVFLGYTAGFYETGSNKLFVDNAPRANESDARSKALIYGVFNSTSATQTLQFNAITNINGSLRLWADGIDSTFVGRDAGLNNNTPSAANGIYNTFVGSQAGKLNTSGYAQTFLGYAAGAANTTGIVNTFLGYQSGTANTIGNQNTFIGTDAGAANVAGDNSVIIGFHAGLGSNPADGQGENVLIGSETVQGSSTGTLNTIIGHRSGYSNTSGYANTFLGHLSGFAATTGTFNTFLGESSGTSVVGGATSTYIGSRSGYSNVSGSSNVFLGFGSGFYETGSNKLFIDNQSRANEADGRAKALIYGEFAASTFSQLVRINGHAQVAESLKLDNTATGYIEGTEQASSPAAPAANGFRIYAKDNGAGKTVLYVRFASGAEQQIAIEP